MRRLFENLFRNSLEHGLPREEPVGSGGRSGDTPSQPTKSSADLTVAVGVDREPHGPTVFVEDDGRGIPPDERADVLDEGYSTREEGTGLGLNIVEQIAEGHGWTVRVEESAAGGARFSFTGVEPA
ncbi:MAG: sensor histidine kinase [Verrucomicrobiota bacterium]